MQPDNLGRAIELIKSGDKQTALPLLQEIIKANPDDAIAWSWLYACVGEKEKKYCLQQVLRIQPDNQNAKAALAKFENQTQPTPEQTQQTNIKSPVFSQQVSEPNFAKVFPNGETMQNRSFTLDIENLIGAGIFPLLIIIMLELTTVFQISFGVLS